jgi:hypothetical protein
MRGNSSPQSLKCLFVQANEIMSRIEWRKSSGAHVGTHTHTVQHTSHNTVSGARSGRRPWNFKGHEICQKAGGATMTEKGEYTVTTCSALK